MLLPLIETPNEVEHDSGFGIRTRRVTDAPIVIRTASARDADAIHELIDEHLTEGHLLVVPRVVVRRRLVRPDVEHDPGRLTSFCPVNRQLARGLLVPLDVEPQHVPDLGPHC